MSRHRGLSRYHNRGFAGVSLDQGSAAILTAKKWKNGRVLKVSLSGATQKIQDRVRHYAALWSDYANITFDFSGGASSEIRVEFNVGDGSWSVIGTDALSASGQTMNYGWFTDNTNEEEFRRVIVHEFGHALGLAPMLFS